jgi:tubulin polyglutamylase TTLL6/13
MGRGIMLLQTPEQLTAATVSHCIAQQYIPRPMLLDGLKFDLRIYAMVTSVDPLRIYMFDEGLARLATVPYAEPDDTNLGIAHMHLTNHAINRNAPGYTPVDLPCGLQVGVLSRLDRVMM